MMALTVLLAGCPVGPNFKTPAAPINAEWSSHTDPRIAPSNEGVGRWWTIFQDPALTRLVQLAHEQNLSLQVAGLRIIEARARLGVATGRLWPQTQVVGGSASAIGVTKSLADAAGFNRNFANYQLGFDAAWELDFWGKYRRGIEAETNSMFASVADYDAALVGLTAEVARTYTMIRTFQVLVEQAESNAKLQEEALRIADARFRNGATSELDVAQASTLLESTRASIPQLRASLRQSENALSTLLGQPTGNVESLLSGHKDIPKAPEKLSVTVPAEMLRRRPDIRSAELNAAAQCARIGIAKAELYPKFSLRGAVGFWGNSTGMGSHNLFSADNIFYSFGPQVSWPFLNYGRIKNAMRIEDARFQQLLVGYRNAVLKAAQEVEDSMVGFLHMQDAMVFQAKSVDAAKRSEHLAVVQYEEGAVDYQRVLDAQRYLLQQQNEFAEIESAVATNLIALYKALGGGWEVREGKPIIPEDMQKEMQDRTDWDDVLSEVSAPSHESAPASGKH